MTKRPTTGVRHLSKSPIAEATLDVTIEARPGLQGIDFRALRDTLRADFPIADARRQVMATFELGTDKPPSKTEKSAVDAYLFRSADGKDVAQFRVDGFTLNRLAPYPGWSSWFPRFTALWQMYVEIAKPVRVLRVGSRCINVIPIGTGLPLSEYLTKPPDVADGLPTELKGFIWRVELGDAANPALSLNMVHILQLAPAISSYQLLLDIDAYMIEDVPVDQVPGSFESLHALRNEAFFRTLTPATIKQFE